MDEHSPFAPGYHDAHLLNVLAATVSDAVILTDPGGLVRSWNHGAWRLYGYDATEAKGRPVDALIDLEDPAKLGAVLEQVAAGATVTDRQLHHAKDSRPLRVALSAAPVRDVGGELTGVLFISRDLGSARAQIEHRVAEQARLARLGDMAGVIAHEVRNPLAAVRGAIQVIGSRLPESSADAPVIREIVARLDGLGDMLEGLLLYARAPEARMGVVDVASVIQTVRARQAGHPAFANVAVHVDGSARPVSGDTDLLAIAFEKILTNAAQAMEGRGTIRVGLRHESGAQRITIADDGPGLSPDAQEHLFEPFFTTKARGAGLGLPTAKRLLELHAGSIDVHSPPQGGTVVTVTLPARPLQTE